MFPFDEGGEVRYEFDCSDLIADCDEVVRGDTKDGIVDDVVEHMRDHHGMIELPPDLVKRVLASVRP